MHLHSLQHVIVMLIISTAVDGINGSGQLTAGQECFIDDGSSIIIWTTHFTKFGVTRGTSTTTTSGTTAGSAGGTGASAGASSSGGPRGFGGILGTPLTINEVSYDKCVENIARILISSDAETLPSVIIHTTRTGSVAAILSDDQPYEELNKITRVDKYLYEIPIDSDETFLMIVVTE